MIPDKPIVLLLIDDDEDDRDFYKIALADVNLEFECEVAKGAKEALAMLEKNEIKPDFIFLDLNMPGMNGRVCLKRLKENPATEPIPVIIFSTSSELADINEIKALGAMSFMTKPPSLPQLSINLYNFFIQQLQN